MAAMLPPYCQLRLPFASPGRRSKGLLQIGDILNSRINFLLCAGGWLLACLQSSLPSSFLLEDHLQLENLGSGRGL